MKYTVDIDLMPWMVGKEGITLAVFLEQLAADVDDTPGAKASMAADRIRALAKWARDVLDAAIDKLYDRISALEKQVEEKKA